jgi:hypothetical protein
MSTAVVLRSLTLRIPILHFGIVRNARPKWSHFKRLPGRASRAAHRYERSSSILPRCDKIWLLDPTAIDGEDATPVRNAWRRSRQIRARMSVPLYRFLFAHLACTFAGSAYGP